MRQENATVGIFDADAAAKAAVQRLQESGFDLKKVSVAGKDDHTGGQIISYYNNGGDMRYWGRLESFWGSLWGLLSGWAFLAIPGIGPVLVAGPLARWVIATLDNASIFGGLTALGAGLYSIGISRDSVLGCELAVRDGKYLVLVHGAAREVDRVKEILHLTGGGPVSFQPSAENPY